MQAINEYKELFEEEYGTKLTDKEAELYSLEFIKFYVETIIGEQLKMKNKENDFKINYTKK